MAATLYDLGRDAFLNKLIDWVNDTIKVAAVGAGYTANMATDQFYTAISAYVIGTPVALTGKSTAAGVAAASDATTGVIATGSTITQIVIYQDTGTAGTSRLIAREDVTSTPTNGGTVTFSWDTGANKIFKL
jgi:hypothetical protein